MKSTAHLAPVVSRYYDEAMYRLTELADIAARRMCFQAYEAVISTSWTLEFLSLNPAPYVTTPWFDVLRRVDDLSSWLQHEGPRFVATLEMRDLS